MESRDPTEDWDPVQECVYDNQGTLVGPGHQYAGCQGTPDHFSANRHVWWQTLLHATYDPGGPCDFSPNGGGCKLAASSFWESMGFLDDQLRDALLELFDEGENIFFSF